VDKRRTRSKEEEEATKTIPRAKPHTQRAMVESENSSAVG